MLELSREQARALDRIAMEEYGIPGVVLMENAGAGAARRIVAAIGGGPGSGEPPGVDILCGGGNNGGDGWVVARHLHAEGWTVRVFSSVDPNSLVGDAATMARIVGRLPIPVRSIESQEEGHAWGASWWSGPRRGSEGEAVPGTRVLVDGLLGTGFRGAVRPGPIRGLLEGLRSGEPAGSWGQDSDSESSGASAALDCGPGPRVLRVALDLPSGLDADTGRTEGPGDGLAFRADRTLTFAARKPGLRLGRGPRFCGTIEVVPIGTTLELAQRAVHGTPGADRSHRDAPADSGPGSSPSSSTT